MKRTEVWGKLMAARKLVNFKKSILPENIFFLCRSTGRAASNMKASHY